MTTINSVPSCVELQTDILKFLSKQENIKKYINGNVIHDNVFSKYDIKDPIEKQHFKNRFFVVLATLKSEYDDVSIVSKTINLKKFYSAGLFIETDDNSLETDNTFKSINKEQEKQMPSEIDAIQYILDSEYASFLDDKKFENGNTYLHILINHSDIIRIRKLISDDSINGYSNILLFFDVRNNEEKTPIDYISDIRINNEITKILLFRDKKSKNDINIIKEFVNDMVRHNQKEMDIYWSIYWAVYFISRVGLMIYIIMF